ncbi:MAG: DMT family transporter [Bacteroidales bacterium]|nr:DMT family transporter [Bacteroidales bacterium]
MNKDTLTGNLASAAAYTIFGLNIVFTKDITNSGLFGPFALFALRAFGAASLFWLLSAFTPPEKIQKGDWWKIALASFIGFFLVQISFLVGIRKATAIDCSIISALSPVMTMLVAAVAIKEPITLPKACGVGLSFAGILFLILTSYHGGGASSTTPAGVILLVVNSLSFAVYLGAFKPLISRYSVVTFMKWVFVFCLIYNLPLSFGEIFSIDWSLVSGKLYFEIWYLVFMATFVSYFLIPYGQKRVRPTIVGMYSYLQPFLAAVVSIISGLDVLTWTKVAATVLIVLGVVMVNRSRARQE